MVAMTLGVVLISLMVGTINTILHASRVSAEATETIERGYFLMDAIDNWVAKTSPISHDMFSKVSEQHSASMLSAFAEGALDLCETPDIASLPPASPGIILLEPSAWPCVPQRNLEVSASALLLERRLPCRANCNGAGFYAVPQRCVASSGSEQGGMTELARANSASADLANSEFNAFEFASRPVAASEFEAGERFQFQIFWLDADHDRPPCFENGRALNVTRSLIYVRDYAWRVGDGIRALMIRDLAQEPKARWLRSSMLAHGIDGWQIECLSDCSEVAGAGNGALLAAAIDLRFEVNSRSQSVAIQRALSHVKP